MAEKDSTTENPIFNDLLTSFWEPRDRLCGLAQQFRKIAADLEAGKEVNPKRIKKLAGSLYYWTGKMHDAACFICANPGKVMTAKGKWIIQEKKKDTPMGAVLNILYPGL